MSLLTRLSQVVAAATLTAIPMTGVLATSPASAAITCAPINDTADILDDTAIDQTIAAAPQARVFVFAFTSVPGGDLKGYVADQRDQCENMRGASGGWASDVIAVAVSVNDRKAGVYYGTRYENALGNGRWESASNAMGPYFADGNYTAGINAGLDAVDGYIANPTSTNTSTASEPSEPIDVPWAWILGVPTGAAALGGAGFLGVRTRRRLIERNTLRKQANTATDEAAAKFTELDNLTKLVKARVDVLPNVDDDGLNDIRERHTSVAKQSETAINTYMAHTETWTTTAIGDTTLDTAATAAAESEKVREVLAAALSRMESMDAQITALEERNAKTPQVLDATLAKVAETMPVLDGLDTEGYKTTTLRTTLTDVETMVADARGWFEENLWGEAADMAAKASAEVESAYDEATGMRQRRADIEADIAACTTRHASLAGAAASGEGDLAALTGTFHSSCVEATVTQFNEGRESHERVVGLIDGARRAVGMDQQRFADAEAMLGDVHEALLVAAYAFAAPAEQHARLDALTVTLSQQVASAYADIEQVEHLIANNKAAVKYLDTPVKANVLRHEVSSIEADLRAERPALLALEGELSKARSDIADARRSVENVIREYKEAQAALARAERAVKNAEARSNRSHAGAHSKSLASQARNDLSSADNAMSLALIISQANAVVSTASQAESAANSAISSWEASQSTTSSHSSGGTTTWGGGGGSTDFGGGGGDTSW
jgi:uncharacterized membrane protein YgcG